MSTMTYTYEETSMELLARTARPAPKMTRPASPIEKGRGMLSQALSAASEAEGYLEQTLTKKTRARILGSMGPVLLCLTFLEDGLRIPLRWGEQFDFMTSHRKYWAWFSMLALVLSCALQLTGSFFVLRPTKAGKPSRVVPGAYALLSYTLVQPMLYGTLTDFDFMSRALTLSGGFLLLILGEKRKAGNDYNLGSLLAANDVDPRKADLVQLVGRLMLTFLFLFQAIFEEKGGLHSLLTAPSLLNVLSTLLLFGLSLMTCAGFKTEWSSLGLSLVLGVSAVWMYPFWSAPLHLADYYRYYFFQTISSMGGMMLLTVHGPGGLSLGGSKKGL